MNPRNDDSDKRILRLEGKSSLFEARVQDVQTGSSMDDFTAVKYKTVNFFFVASNITHSEVRCSE